MTLAHARCILGKVSKTRYTQSNYVILIVFPQQHWASLDVSVKEKIFPIVGFKPGPSNS
jgi:hypothetical protein